MSQQQVYFAWKKKVLGKQLDIDHNYGDQCVDVDLSYGQALFPGVAWQTVFPPVPGAKDMFGHYNPKYFTAIKNNPKDTTQLPIQGDIIFFNYGTYGHTGVVDSATNTSITIVEQNGRETAAASTDKAHLTKYGWLTLGLPIGWLRPKLPEPAPKPAMITLAQLNQLYKDLLGRTKNTKGNYADDAGIAHYAGHYTYAFTESDIKKSAEYKQHQAVLAKETTNAPTQPPKTTPAQPDKPAAPAPQAPVAAPTPVQPPVVQPPVETQPAPTAPETAPAPSKIDTNSPPEAKTTPAQEFFAQLWQLVVAIIKRLFGAK